MKKPGATELAVRALADEYFAGRVPSVPRELDAAVRAEVARRAWSLTGLRQLGDQLQRIQRRPRPEKGDKALLLICRMAVRATPRPPILMPKAADPVSAFLMSLQLANGPALSAEERGLLFPAAGPDGCRVRRAGFGLPDHTPPSLDPSEWHVPEELRVSDAARELAMAFARQMLAEAEAAGRPPLIGSFVMKAPDYLPLLREMETDHIRLLIRPHGIWCSYVWPSGEIAPFWWSPRRDTVWVIPGRVGWATRVFLACLWRDATVVRDSRVFRVQNPGSRRDRPADLDRPPRERVVILPRALRQMEWTDEDFERYYDGLGHATHNVRAHYRRLPETWRASAEATRLAERFGYPAPPDGYTFVRPYTVGDETAAPPPRVVAKGLQVAGVVLARL